MHSPFIDLRQGLPFWARLESCIEFLAPLAELTTKLQDEQLTIPRFNEYWTIAELDLKAAIDKSGWTAAKPLLELLSSRREKINENPLVIAGIYLDPRMRKSLGPEQTRIARDVVEAVYHRLCSQNLQDELQPSRTDTGDGNSGNEPPSKFGKLFNTLNPIKEASTQTQCVIKTLLDRYQRDNFEEKITHLTDPSAYWFKRTKDIDETISTLSQAALTIITCPLTEVTSERLFSLLRFVQNDLRCNLKEDIIDDTLLCKWNAGRMDFVFT